MATRIVMPSFGMYTAEGTVAHWLQPSGTRVQIGDPVLEIETDKALNEIVAPTSGTLLHVAAVGTLIKEEGLLGYILAEGESTPVGSDTESATASVSTMAKNAVRPSISGESPVKASPLARNLAKEHGVDLTILQGSGPGGRVVEADVLAWIERMKREASEATGDTHSPTLKQAFPGKRVVLTTMRKSIGERLRRSLDVAVPLTITREAEAGYIVATRARIAKDTNRSLPYDALFMKFLALTLQEFPGLNVFVDRESVIQLNDINIGFAVALPEGLVVPVVRNVNTLPLQKIADEIQRLTELARSNRLRNEDLSDGSSTVTNLGRYGVDAFTPILNPPQSTILGVGRILQRPVVQNGALTTASTCWLSLTFDHRITDGAPAAQALNAIARLMNDSNYLSTLQ